MKKAIDKQVRKTGTAQLGVDNSRKEIKRSTYGDLKIDKISKDKVQDMMLNGTFKTDLKVKDMMEIEELLKVEVGLDLEPEEIGVCPTHGTVLVEDGFFYRGNEYHMINLMSDRKIVLIGRHGGLIITRKCILGTVNTRVVEGGKVYDTATAKFIERRIDVIKEKPFDAVIFDFYETISGDYFIHVVAVVMDAILNGSNKMSKKYICQIEPLHKKGLVKEYGTFKNAQRIFNEAAPNLEELLVEPIENQCVVCGACNK